MHIERVPVASLNPAPYNPRKDLKPGDPEFERLRRSVDEFGLVEPLVWNRRTGVLVGGHQRLNVMIERGDTEVEVSVVDLSPEREKALNLALNKIQGEWDFEKLAAVLAELCQMPDFDVSLSGFEQAEVGEILRTAFPTGENADDFDAEAELAKGGPTITQPGDMIVLGCGTAAGKGPRHILLCGDCTDPAQVRRLIEAGGGTRAALFATDPPYLVDYDGTNHPGNKLDGKRRRKVRNKDWSDTYGVTWDDADANADLYEKFIAVAVQEAIEPGAAWYCWHASKRQAMVEKAWADHGAFVHAQIVWVKGRGVLTRTWYLWRHEPCFFGWVKGNKPRRAPGEPMLSTVWEFDTIANGAERPDHPTPKPVALFEIPMRQHTRPGDVCYEPFAGSGTQIIAAERTGRRCLAIEISPRYCDVIVRRFLRIWPEGAPPEVRARYAVQNEEAGPGPGAESGAGSGGGGER